jgi:hypothetical protein
MWLPTSNDCVINTKKVKYAYQEWPHPADTAYPHSRHSLHTQQTQPSHTADTAYPYSQKVEKKRAWFYNNQLQKRHQKQLTKVRTRGITALERSVAKQFATGGLNQVLGCTKLTLAPTGSHINKQVHVVLVK